MVTNCTSQLILQQILPISMIIATNATLTQLAKPVSLALPILLSELQDKKEENAIIPQQMLRHNVVDRDITCGNKLLAIPISQLVRYSASANWLLFHQIQIKLDVILFIMQSQILG